MDILKAFLALVFFAIEAEAPVSYKTPSQHATHRDHIPTHKTSSQHATPRDRIPSYSESTSATYAEAYLFDGWPMSFYSKNMGMDLHYLHDRAVLESGRRLAFEKGTDHYAADDGFHAIEATEQAAKDHIKAYADHWHGGMPSWDNKDYKIVDHKMKQLISERGDTYQLYARMTTTDEALEMCCNMVIHSQWEKGNEYALLCGEPACFRLYQGKHGAPCPFLDIVPGAPDKIQYTNCIKDVDRSNPVQTSPSRHGSPTHVVLPHPSTSSRSAAYGNTYVVDDTEMGGVSFISKNLDLDAIITHKIATIVRNKRQISFVKETRISDSDEEQDDFMNTLAANHIEAYADVMHGIHGQKYAVASTMMKRVTMSDNGPVFQLNARLRSGDQEICCNLLLNGKWLGGSKYEFSCAQPACYKVANGECHYLKIAHQINNSNAYKTCWKEVK